MTPEQFKIHMGVLEQINSNIVILCILVVLLIVGLVLAWTTRQ